MRNRKRRWWVRFYRQGLDFIIDQCWDKTVTVKGHPGKEKFKTGGCVPGPDYLYFPYQEKSLEQRWYDRPEIIEILQGMTMRKKMENEKNETGSKYLRRIVVKNVMVTENAEGAYGDVDVYAVVEAFDVRCGAVGHALKKLLCPGARGGKDTLQDLKEAKDSIIRAYEMEASRQAMGVVKTI